MNEERKKKQLISRIRCLKEDSDVLKLQIAQIQREYENKLKEMKKLQEYVESLEKPLTVSDHAIVRYCERVIGIDVDAIKTTILSPELCELSQKVGTDFTLESGDVRFVVRNNIVTTVTVEGRSV